MRVWIRSECAGVAGSGVEVASALESNAMKR